MKHPVGTLTEDELKKAIQQVFKRSQTDATFRKLCLNNPALAIREVSGKSLPNDIQIQFLEQK
ncbi:MAG: hypothetical protein ACLPID_05175 [Beijerinckiaceae bacterium]